MSSEHVDRYPFAVVKQDRERLHGHGGGIVWFTGISGSGKSTIANEVEQRLHARGISTYILDGDHLRFGLNHGLGFSTEDRNENIRRAGEVARMLVDCGVLVLATFISPYRAHRAFVRSLVEPHEFIEVYVRCPLERCEQRDPKGLYRRARSGEIPNFTAVSSPYEEPEQPEIVLQTDEQSVEASAEQVVYYLISKGYFQE